MISGEILWGEIPWKRDWPHAIRDSLAIHLVLVKCSYSPSVAVAFRNAQGVKDPLKRGADPIACRRNAIRLSHSKSYT